MNEWNAIDLHMHTCEGVTRKKGRDDVIFSYTDMQNVIEKFELKLMAVTNHNIINMSNYILMRYIAKKNSSKILMGVELDTNLSIGIPIHIVVIFEENFNENFEAMIDINATTKEKKNLPEVCYSNNEIINLLKKYDIILIPHGCKHKGIFEDATPERINEALKKVREGFFRIFDSPSDWKLEKIKESLRELDEENLDEFGGVLFSDTRDWPNYAKSSRDFYMNAEPSFKGIVHSISNPIYRLKPKKEIKRNSNYIKRIKFISRNRKSKIADGEIVLSSGYNCIIGKSGSGKSLLLHMIKKKLLRGFNPSDTYSFSDDTDVEIYNEDGKILNENVINISVGVSIYQKIIEVVSKDDTDELYEIIKLLDDSFVGKEKFNTFKKKYKNTIDEFVRLRYETKNGKEELLTRLNKLFDDIKRKNDLREIQLFDVKPIKKENLNSISDNDVKIFESFNDYINECKNISDLYKGKYKEQLTKDIEKLRQTFSMSLLDILKNNAVNNLIYKKIDIINGIIETINSQKSEQAKQKSILVKSIPNDINDIVNLILKMKLNEIKINHVDLSIKKEEIYSSKKINGNVEIIEEFPINELTEVNEKDNKIFHTYGKKGTLSGIKNYDITKPQDAKRLVNKYINLGVLQESGNNYFEEAKLDIRILFDGQDIKAMNPGSIAKKYIQMYFDSQVKNGTNNVVLFDQIENDVDKEFINSVINDNINGTKGCVQLIVVTHDPIVAVNADPNNYIECTRNESKKIEYRSFVAESYKQDELNTIARNVDGSKDVIRKRYEIYEGGNIHGN